MASLIPQRDEIVGLFRLGQSNVANAVREALNIRSYGKGLQRRLEVLAGGTFGRDVRFDQAAQTAVANAADFLLVQEGERLAIDEIAALRRIAN